MIVSVIVSVCDRPLCVCYEAEMRECGALSLSLISLCEIFWIFLSRCVCVRDERLFVGCERACHARQKDAGQLVPTEILKTVDGHNSHHLVDTATFSTISVMTPLHHRHQQHHHHQPRRRHPTLSLPRIAHHSRTPYLA